MEKQWCRPNRLLPPGKQLPGLTLWEEGPWAPLFLPLALRKHRPAREELFLPAFSQPEAHRDESHWGVWLLGSGPQPHQLFSQSAEQKLRVTKCKVKVPKAGVERDQWNGVWKTHRLLGPQPGFKFQPCHQPTCVILGKLINPYYWVYLIHIIAYNNPYHIGVHED